VTGFIDLHSHILPDIDDGPKNIQESLKLLKSGEKENIKTIVATPHFIHGMYEPKKEDILQKVKLVKKYTSIEILPGAELMIDPNFQKEDYFTYSINFSNKYVLIEFPMTVFLNVLNTLKNIRDFGIIPILAHIDRYPWLLNNLEMLKEIIGLGIITHINAVSIIESPKFFLNLINDGFVHFVASDAHSVDWRPFLLKKAYEIVYGKLGVRADIVFYENPYRIIKGERLFVSEPIVPKRRRMFKKRR